MKNYDVLTDLYGTKAILNKMNDEAFYNNN